MDGCAPPRPDTLPAPPVPPEADLTGYDWFPLHHKRLDQSSWWLSASDFARSRNIDLWSAAYQQVPAASLPDNDIVLARFAGFGRDVAGFRAAKAELLEPWTLCSDGRWYHPVLAEVAATAWETRSEAVARKAADRERKRAARVSAGKAEMSGGHPEDVRRTSSGNPAENALKGQERTGKEEEADASPSNARVRDEGEGDVAIAAIQRLYAEKVIKGRGSPMQSRSALMQLSDDDRAKVLAAIPRFAEAKPWGSNGPPSLERFVREWVWSDFVTTAEVISTVWNGPATFREAVVRERGDAFARSYLDPAEWRQDGAAVEIIALSSRAAAELKTLLCLSDSIIVSVKKKQA